MGTSTVRENGMTYVSAAYPNVNSDASSTAALRTGGLGDTIAYLYMNVNVPKGATVVSATLRLQTVTDYAVAGTKTITLARLAESTKFSRVTYATRPTSIVSGSSATVSKTGTIAAGTEWAFDVTAQMQAVADGDKWYGWRITGNFNPYVNLATGTYKFTDRRPVLEIAWSDAPDAPSTLTPSGGLAVSIAKPILRFDYTDVSGSVQLQAVQVQINATNVFTAPTFDSGTVVASSPQLDLSATAYAGLGAGATAYWRVRVQDAAGLWSPWSPSTSFTRTGKGTLTVSNPDSVGQVVTEATPPVNWAFTGTQTAYQVFVTVPRPTTGSWAMTPIWSSGKITGTATSVTLPTGVLAAKGATYRVVVRVWDNVARVATSGDPIYSEVIRPFAYLPDATTAPVTALAASQVTGRIRTLLTWSRSTAPDYYTILRNGDVVASRVPSGDLSTGGTAYAYTDLGPAPVKATTYEVRAVVNGKEAASSPTVTITLKGFGVWLSDIDHSNNVLIVNPDTGNVTMAEQSTVTEVVGASAVVLTTQGIRGYEGSISGELHSNVEATSITASGWRDRALAIKGQVGSLCWLTFADVTIKAVIYNLPVAPMQTSPLSFRISFDFAQQSDLDFRVYL